MVDRSNEQAISPFGTQIYSASFHVGRVTDRHCDYGDLGKYGFIYLGGRAARCQDFQDQGHDREDQFCFDGTI